MSVMQKRTTNNLIHYGMDYVTDGGRTLPLNQASINVGDSYSAHCGIETLPYMTPYDVLFTTPADRYVHLLQYNFYLMSGIGMCQLWENVDSYAGGDVLNSYNRTRPPLSIPAPTTSTTGAPVSSTTGAPATTISPIPIILLADLEFRALWSEFDRFIIGDNENQQHIYNSSVILREGGIATLGGAELIDVFRFNYPIRAQAHLQDEKWILKRCTNYLFRFIKVYPPPVATTTMAPTTTGGPQ